MRLDPLGSRPLIGFLAALAGIASLSACAPADEPQAPIPTRRVRIRIENIAAPNEIIAAGGPVTFLLPPGAWALRDGDSPFYTLGEPDRGDGLEALAEDGEPTSVAEALVAQGERAGVFAYNVATYEEGSLGAGEAFVLDVDARDTDRLHLVTMMGQSNDSFFTTPSEGIPLFVDGALTTVDVAAQMLVVDLGTEVNQPIGEGADQAPRQAAPNTGADENGVTTVEPELIANHFVRVTLTAR